MVYIHLSNPDLLGRKLTFSYFLEDKIYYGYSLETPRSEKRNKKNIFNTLRSNGYDVLLPGQVK